MFAVIMDVISISLLNVKSTSFQIQLGWNGGPELKRYMSANFVFDTVVGKQFQILVTIDPIKQGKKTLKSIRVAFLSLIVSFDNCCHHIMLCFNHSHPLFYDSCTSMHGSPAPTWHINFWCLCGVVQFGVSTAVKFNAPQPIGQASQESWKDLNATIGKGEIRMGGQKINQTNGEEHAHRLTSHTYNPSITHSSALSHKFTVFGVFYYRWYWISILWCIGSNFISW